MHYFFFDESYPSHSIDQRMVVAVWGVGQERFTRYQPHIDNLFKPPVLKRIESMMESLEARAAIGVATLQRGILRTGEFDGTNDVPKMARADNVWSQCVAFTTAALLAEYLIAGEPIGTVDMYFDPKDLKLEHRVAFEAALREQAVGEAKRQASKRGRDLFKKLNVRRIQAVPKPKRDEEPNKFQMGVWVADKLCSNVGKLVEGSGHSARILVDDISSSPARVILYHSSG